MKFHECQRSRSLFDLFKVKTCFSQKQLGDLERTKAHMKAYGRMGMKIYTNELGHMINMAGMPIYGKNLKNLLQNQ